jgi:hypothetical protein
MVLAEIAEVITGYCGIPAGMMMSSPAAGTVLLFQLVGVVQFVSVAPVHVCSRP